MVPGEYMELYSLEGHGQQKFYVEERRAYCSVQDNTSASSKKQLTTKVNFVIGSTIGELMKYFEQKLGYDLATVDIVLNKRKEQVILSQKSDDELLHDVGFDFRFTRMSLNDIIVVDKGSGGPPKKTEVNEVQTDVLRDGSGDASATYVPPPAPPRYKSVETEFLYNYSYSSAVIKPDTGFVGLVNQAMTCYLNSLLQTLYMTPEFRNALYRWEFDGSEEEGTKSIPFQLQRLFLQLQTSKKPAVGTTELTTSFGWDSSEAWQQHDVQELCRVMFDALEQKFKNTEQADLISTLYEGKLRDYVKCLECDSESARDDTFLDVPLVVRPFGSSEAYGSVEEALRAFVTPEILQGCNQYFCEHCGKKCDAHKGLKFIKFPYLLTLQLKRFDFDPVTMHRIKLNDRVTFPELLNLNDFIKEEKLEDSYNDGDTTDSGSALDDDGLCYGGSGKTENTNSPEAIVDTMDHADDDEGIDVGMVMPPQCRNSEEMTTNEKNLRKSMEKGPYQYELFSIMVHSGSANGGHYYAYIKSFKDGEWYCFNDAQVTRITYDDIQKTYGGGPSRGYYSNAYSSSINAYMLMYRQIDKARNAEFISVENFPEHITTLLRNMVEQEERERQQRELDRYMCKINLFCQHPVQQRMIDMKLKVHRDCTLAEATATARTIMGLESTVPLDCCRLVKYDDFHESLECSFDGSEDETIGELLGGVKPSYKFDLLLEIKQPHEEFQEYKPGGTTVKIHVVDLKIEEVSATPHTVRSHLSETVGGFKNQVSKVLGVGVNMLRMAIEVYNNEVKPLEDNSALLQSVGFEKSNKVFVEHSDEEDSKRSFEQSKFYATLDRYFHTICIYVCLPKVDKLILEKLRIPENDCGKYDTQSEEESSEEENTTVLCFDKRERNFSKVHRDRCSIEGSCRYKLYRNRACQSTLKVSSPVSGCEPNKKTYPVITPDDSSQDCDEGLGDSEIGDTCSTSGYQTCQAVHSDQSEDSSLTDSERTLVGDELSPHNNSPDIIGTEMEIDAEPSHALDPDVSRPDSDSAHSSSDSNFQVDEQTEDLSNPSSPEDNAKDSKCCVQLDFLKTSRCHSSSDLPTVVIKRYFRAWPYTEHETGEKMLRVYVDKRITLEVLKKELEPFVGVGTDCFKIYRLYSNNQEFECTRPAENLLSYTDDTKLKVKLGRALRKGEYKVKIYHLCINDSEPMKYLIDWVFYKGMTVLQAKKEILPVIKESCQLEIPLNRCRLRKKSWKNPGTIFLDHQRFEKDIPVNTNWEVFLEILTDAETITSQDQLAVFVKRWHPSTYTLDKFQEIVIKPTTIECLKSKISEISGIPKENVEFAMGTGTFPCDISLLSIHNELEWHSCLQTINTWALTLGDDGHVVYYRDSREELKQLTEEEKREIMNKENARSNKIHKTTFSPRKEKALKIYTLDSTPCKRTSGCSTSSEADSLKQLSVPDLD